MTDTPATVGERHRPRPVAGSTTSLPRKPGPSMFAIGSIAVAVALTVVTAWDWKWGIGVRPLQFFRNLTRDNPAISAIPHADLGQLFSGRTRGAFFETVRLSVLGTVAGTILALPLAVLTSSVGAATRGVRFVARGFSNVIRAFPDILWALLFRAAVGIGPLAGLLALFFFSLAVCTKLTSDSLDVVDGGPIEAADAAGASRTKMRKTALVPQILPAYASFVLYCFELNLRASAVIGLVGAGGVGGRIDFFRNNQAWEQMWGIVIMFFLVVFVVDRLSAYLRRRLL